MKFESFGKKDMQIQCPGISERRKVRVGVGGILEEQFCPISRQESKLFEFYLSRDAGHARVLLHTSPDSVPSDRLDSKL